MSRLTVYPDDASRAPVLDTSDAAEIARALQSVHVRFERWRAERALPKQANEAAIVDAYRADIERLMRAGSYQSVDVVRCLPENPQASELRAKFLAEHIHEDDEVRFFVEGSGMFYLHLASKVYMVLCERNDLISVPAGTRHWFDMGPRPYFAAIRLFTRPDGWVARFTGDTIATRFPAFEPGPA